MGELPKISSNMRSNFMRIALGNMPAGSTANLRAFCSQKLTLEDQSYCYRLPMTFVPAYLGPASALAINMDENTDAEDEQTSSTVEFM